MKNKIWCAYCNYPNNEEALEIINWVKHYTINKVCKQWILKHGYDKDKVAEWLKREFMES
jgi:hypothetical protein